MVGRQHFSRIDLPEVKNHIFREIGHQRAEQYFELLKQFLESKLSKVEFDKRCADVIGKENISLHNHLIRSIIHNVVRAKVPPPKPQKVQGLSVKVPNTCQKKSVQFISGKALLESPRKCRSAIRDRKFQDRHSPLGPLGKSPSLTYEETTSRLQEESAAETQSLSSKPLVNEDGEEVEQDAAQVPINQWPWVNVTAPFGVSVNNGDAPTSPSPGFSYNGVVETCQTSQDLPDTVSLWNRIQKKMAQKGIGVSLESAGVLNSSLDAFLKRLIKPCIEVAQSYSVTDRREPPYGQAMPIFNGTIPGHNAPFSAQPRHASPLDFWVAMDSNPYILGQDWPVHLERISHYTVG